MTTDFRALLAQPAPEGPVLQWSENMPPCKDGCRYDHCIAETPFGRFLITWKSWKEYDGPTVDETPWGDWCRPFNSVDEAKAACQQEFNQRLARCALLAQPAPEGLTDEELLKVFLHAKAADMKRQGGLTSSDANGIAKQLDAQTVAGIRAAIAADRARWGTPQPEEVQP